MKTKYPTFKYTLNLWLLIAISFAMRAQNKVIDSLQLEITKVKHDTIKAKLYNELAVNYNDIDNYNIAIKYGDLAKSIAVNYNLPEVIAMASNELALAQEAKGDYAEALKNYYLAYSKFDSIKKWNYTAIIKTNIGNVFFAQKKYDKALSFYASSLVKLKETKNKKYLIPVLFNIANVYDLKHQYNKSLEIYSEALKLNYVIKDTAKFAYIFYHTAGIYTIQKEYDKAFTDYNKSVNYAIRVQDKNSECNAYIGLTNLYVAQHNATQATQYANKAINIAKAIDSKDCLKQSYECLYKADSLQGDYTQALANYKLFLVYADSLEKNQQSNKMLQLQMDFDFQQKQAITTLKLKQYKQQQEFELQQNLERQILIKNILLIGLFIVLLFLGYVYYIYQQKQGLNKNLESKHEQLATRNKTLEAQTQQQAQQRDIIRQQTDVLKNKQQNLLESIMYAQRIQQTLLTSEDYIKAHTHNYFLLYKPKDSVSGDFYWASNIILNDKLEILNKSNASSIVNHHASNFIHSNSVFILATADCTGHGVPGAFMTMLGINFLNEIINKRNYTSPDIVLNKLRGDVIRTLNPHQGQPTQQEGMDCNVLVFDFEKLTLHYAAANNNFYIVRKNNIGEPELTEHKADKMPVGLFHGEMNPFTLQTVQLQKGDTVYTFTDGYADQFGGPKGKKFKYKQFEDLLLANTNYPMPQQKQLLDNAFENWKGQLEQVDDVLVIGIKI